MTAEELTCFITMVRQDIDCAIVELAAIDFDARPEGYADDLRDWVGLRRMSDNEIVELVGAVWTLAGRELGLEELLTQLGLQAPNGDPTAPWAARGARTISTGSSCAGAVDLVRQPESSDTVTDQRGLRTRETSTSQGRRASRPPGLRRRRVS